MGIATTQGHCRARRPPAWCWLAAWLLGACSLAAWAQAPAPGGSPAELFAAMRRAAVDTEPDLAKPARKEPGSTEVPLLDCFDPGMTFGLTESDHDGFAISMAMQVEQAPQTLRALRVPETVWRPALDRWTQLAERYLADLQRRPKPTDTQWQAADDAARRVGEALVRDVNRHQGQRQPRGPRVVLQDGCGAGETPVNIQTRPAGGKVSYLPLFRYRLCEARGLAPQDPRACRGWLDVSKAEEFLSGRYAYQVRWPDGQSSTGVFDTEKARIDDRSGSDVTRIVLKR